MQLKLLSFSKYIKNAILLMGDSIIKLIISFILSIFIARTFGPTKFGQINYVLAVISILQVIVIFGFEDIILKDFGLEIKPDNTILRTVFLLRFFFAIFAYLLGIFLFYYFFDRSLLKTYLILGLEFFCFIFYAYKQWFQIKSLNKYVVLASQISFIVTTTLRIFYLIFFDNLYLYACILLMGLLIEDLVLFISFEQCKDSSVRHFDNEYAKKLLNSSWPLLLQNIAAIIYIRIDQIMVGKMLSISDVGIYSIGVTISELVYFIPNAIANAFYPKVAEAKKTENDYKSVAIRIGQMNVAVCLAFALFCTLIVPFLVTMVYGDAYSAAGRVIQIHSWAGIFVGIGCATGSVFIFEGKQKRLLASSIFATILNVILNYLFIPLWGVNGAAIATLLSYVFSVYLFHLFFKDKSYFVLRTKCFLFYQLLMLVRRKEK